MRIEVDMQLAHDAWRFWFNYHDQTWSRAMTTFKAFTGIESWLERHILVSEEQFSRVKMLASPHAHTLLKAHYARAQDD